MEFQLGLITPHENLGNNIKRKIMKSIYKKTIISVALAGFLVSCGSSGGGDSDSSTSYNLEVSSTSKVSRSEISSKECGAFTESSNGGYNLNECSSEPRVILSKNGFLDRNSNGIQDGDDITIAFPFILNVEQLADVANLKLTPLTTLASVCKNSEELEALAKKFNIDKDSLFSSENIDNTTLDKINGLMLQADKEGIVNKVRFLVLLNEGILNTTSADILSGAIGYMKANKDKYKNDFTIAFEGFVNDVTENSSSFILDQVAKNFEVESDKIVLTGFMYDSIIANAKIEITDNEAVIGEGTSNAIGKWKIKLDKSILDEDKILLFKGTGKDKQGDEVILSLAITTQNLRAMDKNHFSLSDNINLAISNVTTSRVMIVKKQNGGNLPTANEFETQAKNIDTKLLLDTSSAIKVVIDGSVNLKDGENSYDYVDNLLSVENGKVALKIDGSDITQTELNTQTANINKDQTLSKQLSYEYEEDTASKLSYVKPVTTPKIEDNKTTPKINDNPSDDIVDGWILPRGIMTDKTGEIADNGDIIPDFIDLKEMKVDVTDTNIRVEITLKNLPNELPYNQEEIEAGSTEYYWNIIFSIDDNGIDTIGNILFSVRKSKNNDEPQIGSILDFTEKIIFKGKESPNGGIYYEGISDIGLNTSIEGNTIIFDIPKSLHIDLEKITSSTRVSIHTNHNRGKNYDNFPE